MILVRGQRLRFDENMFNEALSLVRKCIKGYMFLNALYYGLIVAFMGYAFVFPESQSALTGVITAATAFQPNFPIAIIVEAYRSGNFPLAAVLTFCFNLALGSFSFITVPSMLLPFGGVVTGTIRAAMWGIIFAPTSPEQVLILIPHSLTIVLEGQAYVLAMFASYVQWKGVLRPKVVGAETRLKAYSVGINNTLNIYVLVVMVLAVSAVYEAFEVIYVLSMFFT